MKNRICTVLAILAVCAVPFEARAGLVEPLMRKFRETLTPAAQADAYVEYCQIDGEMPFSGKILKGAGDSGASPAQAGELRALYEKTKADKLEELKTQAQDCKNNDLLYDRYLLIQSLDVAVAELLAEKEKAGK